MPIIKNSSINDSIESKKYVKNEKCITDQGLEIDSEFEQYEPNLSEFYNKKTKARDKTKEDINLKVLPVILLTGLGATAIADSLDKTDKKDKACTLTRNNAKSMDWEKKTKFDKLKELKHHNSTVKYTSFNLPAKVKYLDQRGNKFNFK